jgi:hypothetical protein
MGDAELLNELVGESSEEEMLAVYVQVDED